MKRMIKAVYFFPSIMIILSIGAAVVYAFDGDWRKTFYWLFAAGLTIVVTF